MTAVEMMIWSMALGAIAALALARAADLALRPSAAQLQAVAYHVGVFILVLVLGGVLKEILQPRPGPLRVAQVLAGPVCVALSNFWIRSWLAARQRDRTMSAILSGSALLLPVAAVACLALPVHLQLPAAAGFSLLGATMTVWMAVRAGLMGDRLAPLMSVGCLLTLPAVAAMYALAMDPAAVDVGTQAAAALSAALSNVITGLVLYLRERHAWTARGTRHPASEFDPVTRTHSGLAIVRRLLRAQRRRLRTKREGALFCVMVFDVEHLSRQLGAAGLNEMYIAMAGRIQRQVGVVNPVGRYWERCFVALVESIHSPGRLRTLGLRVSTSLQRPFEVTGVDGARVHIRPEIGVGIVRVPDGHAPVEDLLDEAQRMAEAARRMPSRSAILDSGSGEVVPVESANLAHRRPHRRGAPFAYDTVEEAPVP